MNIDTGNNFLGLVASTTTQIMQNMSGVISLLLGIFVGLFIISTVVNSIYPQQDDTISP